MQLDWRRIGDACVWRGAQAMAWHAGALHIVDRGTLYRLNSDGEAARIGDAYWHTRQLVAAAGTLLSFEDTGGLYHVLDGGDWQAIPEAGDFTQLHAATALGDEVFAADGGSIYRLRAPFGEAEPVTEWPARMLAGVGNVVAAVSDDSLYRLDGTRIPVELCDIRAVAGWQKRLWVQAGSGFYVVHPLEGMCEPVDVDGAWDTRFLVGGDALYALCASGTLYALSVSTRALSRAR
jgi:hypothetical protein